MPFKCIVYNCDSRHGKNDNKVSLFAIPANKLNEWNKLIPLKTRNITCKDHICEKHFEEDHIIRQINTALYSYDLNKPKLADEAKPTIFPTCPKYYTKVSKKRRAIVKHELPQKKTKLEIVTNPEAQEVISNGDADRNTSLFDLLWNCNVETLNLPNRSWSIHFLDAIENECNENLIVVSQMIAIDGQVYTAKKIVLSEFDTKFYIFEKFIDKEVIYLELDNDSSLNDFEMVLKTFNNDRICRGINKKVIICLKYCSTRKCKKDLVLDIWRHTNCTYIVESRLSNQCPFCHNIEKRLKNKLLLEKNGKKMVSKSEKQEKRMAAIRQQKNRLKRRNALILKELKETQEKLQNIVRQREHIA